jgi:cardiolipin synthase
VVVPGNRLTLLHNGGGYFPALIAAMDGARHEIHLESYIYALDDAGLAVGAALMRAARRGVVTRVLLDGFGARTLAPAFLAELRTAGVELLFYRPERARLRLRRTRLRRMHRKLAVVDACVAFVGGINIIDDLNGRGLTAPRLDYAVRVEGPLVADIHAGVHRLWRLVSWSRIGLRRHEDALLRAPTWPAGRQHAQFLTRDSLRHRRAIEVAYLRAIRRARREIILANAYFLPGLRFRHALVRAARRGARVVLLMQGHTDHPLYRAATRALYGYFLENGIEIHEYHASELHAKVAVIDGRWSTVGSSNIDPFSLMLAREANIVVLDRGFAQELRSALQRAIGDGARQIHRMVWRRTPWHTRFTSWLAYGVVRGLLGLAGFAQRWDGVRQGRGG